MISLTLLQLLIHITCTYLTIDCKEACRVLFQVEGTWTSRIPGVRGGEYPAMFIYPG